MSTTHPSVEPAASIEMEQSLDTAGLKPMRRGSLPK
jgi:hypothetical protein